MNGDDQRSPHSATISDPARFLADSETQMRTLRRVFTAHSTLAVVSMLYSLAYWMQAFGPHSPGGAQLVLVLIVMAEIAALATAYHLLPADSPPQRRVRQLMILAIPALIIIAVLAFIILSDPLSTMAAPVAAGIAFAGMTNLWQTWSRYQAARARYETDRSLAQIMLDNDWRGTA